MGIKNFGVGGIDQKSNNLLREKMDLIDSRNMMANTNGEYVKRPGTEEDTDFTDMYNDMIFIKSLNKYFHREGTDYISYENGVRNVIYKFADPLLSGESKISLAEYLNTAIFTHEEDQNFTAKYDGQTIYRAGLPVPLVTNTTAGALFVIFFYQFIDASGNTIFGPSKIVKAATSTGNFTIPTLKNTGFYSGYIRVPIIAGRGIGPINSSSRTIPYDSISPDIKVGSVVTFRSSNGSPSEAGVSVNNFTGSFFVQFIIESIDTIGNTITFTADSIGENSVFIQSISDGIYNVMGSLSVKYYFSTSETTGYYGLSRDSNYATLDSSFTSQIVPYSASIDTSSLMSNIYDITTSKLRPPKCKYIYTYGYQLVCAPAISFYDFVNQETLYTNNDLIMYSDLSTGDLGENFSESNRQLIGNTYDGQISGLARVKDSLIAFKDTSVFSLDGVLIPGQYSLRKIETDEIGCTSFKSILAVSDGLMFQGQDGIYATDGYKVVKASEKLDPFFSIINNQLTRSVMNNDLDQYLFWTDQGVVVFDYHYKKIFIWDSIDAESGITVDNSRSIRFFSSTSAVKFKDSLNDSGLPIDAFIRSTWFDGGEPGLLKKATFLRIYSMNNVGQEIQLKYFLDWDDSKFKGPFIFEMTDKTIKRNLDVIQNQSFSFEFRNNVLDENLNISGYEINAGVIQERDKNVK